MRETPNEYREVLLASLDLFLWLCQRNLYKGSIIRSPPPQALILFAENVTIYITNTETEISCIVIYLICLEVAWDTRKGGEMQMLSISQRS